ncbi:majorcapsid protein [Pseudomonas phage vB_PaeM_MIJ3]|nr:majorcapsid protein [Pseudomonas phage vB_PaeM_MIJ3]
MSNRLFESNWAATKSALTEGLKGQRKSTMDAVMENTKRFLVENASAGATQAGNIATINKVMLPLIRRVMPSVIANEIMGVQPMTGPVGQIHTLRVRYADTASGVQAGTEALSPFDIAKAYSGNEALNSSTNPVPGAANTSRMEGFAGNRMNIQILKETVEARTRRLSARWTFESAQDANALHGIDIEAEIMQALAQEITVEIDQEMLNRLRILAGPAPVTYNQAAVSGTATYVGDEHAALAVMINQQANLVAARTRRGAANWAVISPNALTVLQSATTSTFARTTEGVFEAPTNVKFAGTLNGTMRIYVDTYAAEDEKVLIGYKGSTETDAAAFFCPYIPLMSTGPVIDPTTFEPVVSFMSRYGYLELTNTANSLGNGADYLSSIAIDASTLKFF